MSIKQNVKSENEYEKEKETKNKTETPDIWKPEHFSFSVKQTSLVFNCTADSPASGIQNINVPHSIEILVPSYIEIIFSCCLATLMAAITLNTENSFVHRINSIHQSTFLHIPLYLIHPTHWHSFTAHWMVSHLFCNKTLIQKY